MRVSFLVSGSTALGVTQGVVEMGDDFLKLRVKIEKSSVVSLGLIRYAPVANKYFFRLEHLILEVDDTAKGTINFNDLSFSLSFS